MKRTTILGVVGLLVSMPLAHAGPGPTIEARMFMHESGTLDDDLFATSARPSVGVLDYGVLSSDVMIAIKVPDGLGPKLNLTIKQGKQTVKRSWNMKVSGYYAAIVPVDQCYPMTITATVGRTTTTKVIDFDCEGY